MNYVAFDLEIAKEIPDGTDDWHNLRPLGITCAATYASNEYTLTWPRTQPQRGPYRPQMSERECKSLVYQLAGYRAMQYPIVTWNGLGFDFDVLLEESQCPGILARLVPHHVDIGFAMFCDKGYMCGLDAAARGMGVGEKMEGVTGKDAPTLWKEGLESQERVLEYVVQDAKITGDVYAAIMDKGYLQWTAKSGRVNKWHMPKSGIPTVREAMGRPFPDTSWMTNPWPREKFSGWLEELLATEG